MRKHTFFSHACIDSGGPLSFRREGRGCWVKRAVSGSWGFSYRNFMRKLSLTRFHKRISPGCWLLLLDSPGFWSWSWQGGAGQNNVKFTQRALASISSTWPRVRTELLPILPSGLISPWAPTPDSPFVTMSIALFLITSCVRAPTSLYCWTHLLL